MKPYFKALFQDNPLDLQDDQTLFSPWRLLIWFSIINISIAVFQFFGMMILKEGQIPIPFGEFFCLLIFMVLGFSLCIFVPIRCFGSIETARTNQYFNQVVLSGIDPTKYILGKVISVNKLFFLIILIIIPWLLIGIGFHLENVFYIAKSIVSLFLFMNFMALFYLILAQNMSEWIATTCCILIFLSLFFFSLFPFSPGTSILSPARVIMDPLWKIYAEETSQIINGINIGIFTLGNTGIFLISMLILIPTLLSLLFIGPLDCIKRQTSNFGAAVLDGDVKKRRVAKRRDLNRRIELSFFYKNISPAFIQKEFFMRWIPLYIISFLFAVALQSVLYMPSINRLEEINSGIFWIFLVYMHFSAFIFSNDRGTFNNNVKPLNINADIIDTISYIVSILIFIIVSSIAPFIHLYFFSIRKSFDVIMAQEIFGASIMFLMAIAFYMAFKNISNRSWNKSSSFLLASVAFYLIFFTPLVIGTVASKALFSDLKFLEPFFILIAYISPFTPLLIYFFDESMGTLDDRPWFAIGVSITFVLWVALAVGFSSLATLNYRKTRNEI
ncbi:MAG: hypothetical protein HRT89_19015 [Lentisphaeria bacterium]|nr:hypothetical protein [Lentisphaeria bacterium]NQZ70149.1 hypothetical protein [Lentisphaeria bacterium]